MYFGSLPVAVTDDIGLKFIHSDHLGTPREITSNGVTVWRWESDPFGATAAQEDPDGDGTDVTIGLRFPGQYFDAELGLHYNYFRTYDPSTGRYIESDPIGLNGGLNTYAYATGNPLSFIDPMGLDPWIGGSAGGRIDMLIGGFGARTGAFTNSSTGETCIVSFRCMNVGLGVLATLSADVSASMLGPKCGSDLNGLALSLTFDIVPPTGTGVGVSIDLTSLGVGAGIGPDAGVGIFGGVSICFARVLTCTNTPCECNK